MAADESPPTRRGAPLKSSRELRPPLRDGCGPGRSRPAAAGAGSGARDMARGSGPLGRPRPDTAAMPKRGKRLKFRAHDACSGRGGRGAAASGGWAGGREGLGAEASARPPAAGGAGPGPRGAAGLAGRPREGRPPALRAGARFSDRGGLCQLGPGRREVWTRQESRGQRRAAGR